MRTRIAVGCAVVASAGLGAFAATGFGERGDEAGVRAVTVETREVSGAPPGARAPAGRASLFRVIYKSTDATDVPTGYSSVTVRSCPRGAAIFSGWFLRAGPDKTGMVASGGAPEGSRRWRLIVNNTSGATRQARFGIICLQG